MQSQDFGGNKVTHIDLGKNQRQQLASGPYEYFIFESTMDGQISFDHLKSFSIYFLGFDPKAKIAINGTNFDVSAGDVVQFENQVADLNFSGGKMQWLVAGTSQPHPGLTGIFHTRSDKHYRVTKPWGYELWLNGQHPNYAFKKIFIEKSNRTSLQFHNFKQETNMLIEGYAKLHYNKNTNAMNDKVEDQDIAAVNLESICAVDVVPKVIHRIEALTDILLFEVSTPHLDDVVRIQDDTRRADGRIAREHR